MAAYAGYAVAAAMFYQAYASGEQASEARKAASKQQRALTADVPKPPAKEDPAIKEAEREERLELKRRRGRKATILTSPWGAKEEPVVSRKTLLGV